MVTITLTETEYWSHHNALLTARDKFKANAALFRELSNASPGAPAEYARARIAEQFDRQVEDVTKMIGKLEEAYELTG